MKQASPRQKRTTSSEPLPGAHLRLFRHRRTYLKRVLPSVGSTIVLHIASLADGEGSLHRLRAHAARSGARTRRDDRGG